MTDGPFKNLKLNRGWKRFIVAVQNDAVNIHERCNFASDALVQDILTSENLELLKDLDDYGCKRQLDIDVLSEIENIFGCHSLTPFAVALKKAIALFLADNLSFTAAFERALKETIINMFNSIKSRLEEEYLLGCENGKLKINQLSVFFKKLNNIFGILSLDPLKILEAIRTRNKVAFKNAVSKKLGLDEGPDFEI